MVNWHNLEVMNETAIEDLLSDLKLFDDMDVEWPTDLLLRALDFPLVTRNSLTNYHLKERTQITLSEEKGSVSIY